MKINLQESNANFRLPSPVQSMHDPLFSRFGIQVDIKRDDLIHPFVSGNKWRKLKNLINFALEQQKKELITFGGAYSNHLLATACAGAIAGLRTTGFVRGEESKVLNDTLFLCKKFGMNLMYLSRDQYPQISGKNSLTFEELKSLGYRKLTAHQILESSADQYWECAADQDVESSADQDVESSADQHLIIPEGGSGIFARQGCAELVDELEFKYDHLIVAAGTATTAAGIANGFAQKSKSTQVEAIVVLKGAEYLEKEICSVLEPDALLNFHHEYHRGGYAKVDQELLSFITAFGKSTGILLDPVYTGKAFMALLDLVTKRYFKPGSKLLFVHTGGLTGLLGFNRA